MATRPSARPKQDEPSRTRSPTDVVEMRARASSGRLRASGLDPGVNEVFLIATDALRGVHRQHKRFSRKTGLTDRSIYILGLISAGLDRPSLLIEYFDILPSTITVETDKLVEAGLIGREPDPSDRRVNRLVLTPAGRKLLLEAMDLINAMYLPRVREIPEAELLACVATLRKIIYPIEPVAAQVPSPAKTTAR